MLFHNMDGDSWGIRCELCKKVFIGMDYSTQANLLVHNQ